MRHQTFSFAGSVIATSLLLALTGCSTYRSSRSHWVSLFDGNDLAGWTVKCQAKDRAKTFWKVEAGSILCDSMGRGDHDYVWLVNERELGNFELQLKFAAYRSSPGNSGVQFRSRFDDAGAGWMDGPQVDIHPPEDMSWRTGLIYDETREERRWISPSLKDSRMDPKFEPHPYSFLYSDQGEQWNDLRLICQGTHVKTILNGVVMTDWDGKGVLDNEAHAKHNVGLRGHFALQLHSGDQMRIRFKDLRVRDL